MRDTRDAHRGQAQTLADAGLDYYNHNLDTSPDFYGEIITRAPIRTVSTRSRPAERSVSASARAGSWAWARRDGSGGLLQQLAILNPHPESVPINLLIQVPGTPLHGLPEFEPLELVRTIAAARIVMPESTIRLSAGRSSMSEETHALCLHAGASSIFLGDRLLTADNNGDDADAAILDQLDVSVRPLDRRVSIES